MGNQARFLSLMILLTAISCQSQKIIHVSTDLPGPNVLSPSTDLSEGIETITVNQTPTDPQSLSTPPTPTASNNERWAVNYPAAFTTADFTIEIVRVEATTKQYCSFQKWAGFHVFFQDATAIVLVFGHLSNETEYRVFWDLNRCNISFNGKLFHNEGFPKWGYGEGLTWDVPPHGSILGTLSYTFSDRSPADIHEINYDCGRPIQKTKPWTDIGDPVQIHMSFDNPGWVEPPEELMEFYQ